MHSKPVRLALPTGMGPAEATAPLQSLAEQPQATSQH